MGQLQLDGGAHGSASLHFRVVPPLPRQTGFGLGDLIQSIARLIGIRSCSACAARAAALNRIALVPLRTRPMLSEKPQGDRRPPGAGPVTEDGVAPVPSSVAVIPAPDDHGCKCNQYIVADNTCTTGDCPPDTACGWTRARVKYWPRFFLQSSDSFRLMWPRDFEPTACGCIDARPRLSAPPPGSAAHQPHEDHGHMPHRPEDEETPQQLINEEELNRLKEGWDLELWTGPGD